MTKTFLLSLSFLAALPFAVVSQAAAVPGFGTVNFSSGSWYESAFGLISFTNGNGDVSRAFSASLGDILATDGSGVYSRVYGRVQPGESAGWVATSHFGWVRFAIGGEDFNRFVWTERVGWIQVDPDPASADPWVFIGLLQSWGKVQSDGSFYSVDHRKLTPTSEPTFFISEVFGLVTVGQVPGWIHSETFGYLWAARGSGGTWFWSEGRNEWLGVMPDNAIWSPSGGFLPRPSVDGGPLDFDINNVVWLHTNLSGWEVTSELTDVSITGGAIRMTFDAGTRWRSFLGGTAYFNATPLVVVKINGTYYAGTWQWFRSGSNSHLKTTNYIWEANKAPINRWRPGSGETVGFLVSTPSRLGVPTRQMERTNILWIEWP